MCDFDDDFDGLDWKDWLIIGPLGDQLAQEKCDEERIRREIDNLDDDYWDIIERSW